MDFAQIARHAVAVVDVAVYAGCTVGLFTVVAPSLFRISAAHAVSFPSLSGAALIVALPPLYWQARRALIESIDWLFGRRSATPNRRSQGKPPDYGG